MKPCMCFRHGYWMCFSDDGVIAGGSTTRRAYAAWIDKRGEWLPCWVAA